MEPRSIEDPFSWANSRSNLANSFFNTGQDDRLIWKISSYDNYSVSQGYQLLLSQQEAISAIQNSTSAINWNWMWKIAIPPKFLVFFWRLYHNAIPTTEILLKHHISVNQHCHFCQAEEESLLYSFVSYMSFFESSLVWLFTYNYVCRFIL